MNIYTILSIAQLGIEPSPYASKAAMRNHYTIGQYVGF